ncbi:RagB/SusD family nutrient uptake outer membrane protein [Marinoscillum sp. MHG1-6]|uniref:RagB/SusD family nutrient uptake outer membrane protein n=1 Tax=Marinoscillum sp. MHG1-6 TaxID=2959627 RepID=UPI0021578785|nr:RagB/SusD family nutrient uptake outer membrane protein [Marinoscillum sp. MHG1-6]
MKNFNIKSYNLVLSFFLLLATVACDGLLDEDPLNQIDSDSFYQNDTDALAGLTGAYAQLKNETGYYRQLWLSNLFAASDQGLSDNHGNFHRGTIADTDPNLPNTWIHIYVAIRDANYVIANVPNIDGIDVELQKRILGEARFLRGLHYLNLVRAFGAVPLRTEPIEPGEYEGLSVSSVLDVYEVVINDLEFAAANCWARLELRNGYTNHLGRATGAAAHALLTKAYLHIASAKRTALAGIEGNQAYLDFPEDVNFYYQKAVDHADAVISSGDHQLVGTLQEWVYLFDADNGNNAEMIFDIQGSNLTEQGTALSNLFSPRNAGLSGGGWGGTNKTVGAFVLNQIDKNDPRFLNSIVQEYEDETVYYVLNPNMNGYLRTEKETGSSLSTQFRVFSAKYIDRSATTEYTSRQNWHVIRLADVHLMRAEALAEINSDPALANTDINLIRGRVGATAFDGTGMTMEDFRTSLLRERGVELSSEGHRFFDLTRMGVYDEYSVTVRGATDGARGPEDYTWPIPLIESSANENIE